MEEWLNIVNNQGKIIGKDTRKNIHKKGLLHREINVLFFTPNKEIIFQKRSILKDTYPGLLDTTVGGHVDLNLSFEQSVLKEIEEEVGLKLKLEDLISFGFFSIKAIDKITGNINNTIKQIFGYLYKDKINNLKIEKGEADGFYKVEINKILSGKMTQKEKKQFTPILLKDKNLLKIFRRIKKLDV